MTPLAQTYQDKLNGAPSSGVISAITAAGIVIELNSKVGWQVAGDATVAAQAQAIIDGYAGSATELNWHKQQALAALAAKYEAIIAAGRLYSVAGGTDSTQHTYQIDEVPPFDPTTDRPTRRSSQDSITSAGAWAGNVVNNVPGTAPWAANFAWSDASNNLVPMTAAQCYAFSQNVAAYVDAVVGNYFALRKQFNAATTVAAVQAIDITAGWPSNP